MCARVVDLFFLAPTPTAPRERPKVPSDLLVAHAEKRVLQGALDQAKQHAADMEVSNAGLCM